VHTDSQGKFTATLLLGNGPSWAPGKHWIEARDATNHRARCFFVLAAITVRGRPTATPTSPGFSPTPTAASGGGPTPVPTAGGSTPVPVTPTPQVTPTPTQAPATPTVGATPTATPTTGVTPTAPSTPGAGGTTPVASPTSTAAPSNASYALSNSLNGSVDSDVTAHLIDGLGKLGPWGWFLMLGYSVAMLMFGMAGVLHKRRRI
jgi:hypothetical protein